ncbi:putative sucrose:sucrose fructosyltransferase [Helianthus annuus]|uniref:Sucrose:sucrose fructosyltransferase n=1 Tax=Helianthus annuus TaxID=4232 RepID=A0A9K3I4T8_HELAN|nr:putative sucrose:sucrose fructosyltransferase [Helianthus annuus]KAJ0533874.1 putative sucrose:sucrose fructosyltransferase [Helianthus annuus]KAJ0892727.1 putative sucrose:sucrose fructosyltransferase [Helianthus annuus]
MASSTTTTTFTSLSTHNHHERSPKSSICRNVLVRLFVSMLVLSSLVVITANSTSPTVEDSVKWQQPAYHFRPHKNFISAPLYYKGWYHLFYQYNPDSVVWGNVTWAHAVSKNLVNWFILPLAMVPDHWYDINGVMSGSATTLPDGRLMMFYSGMSTNLSQLQCLAFPKNSSDPLLMDWVKYDGNPVLYPPPNIGPKDFRDPSNLWIGPDGKYRMIMGSKHNNTIGCVLVFHTTDFIHYKLLDDVLHSVPGTGMWECADIYPVSTMNTNGLDMSVYGSGVKYVLKQSGDEDRHDWYAIGSYDAWNDKWYPDDPEKDLGIGLRYDYGKFYASKTFYDPLKKRRVLWGYVGETDTVKEDRIKRWANILNFPRTVTLDIKTQTNLIQWPIEEVEMLRFKTHFEFKDIELRPGSIVPLNIGSTTKLDISALFKLCQASLNATLESDVSYNCTTSEGSAGRGGLGPFGLLVLADASFTEQTPVYFYIAKNTDGTSRTYFCADESRSSTLSDVGKRVYGSTVPVLHGEDYNMRLLVDHSIVESFAQGGRTVISSRVYPTKAIYKAAKAFLFNNATDISVKASLKIWKMGRAKFKHFPL